MQPFVIKHAPWRALSRRLLSKSSTRNYSVKPRWHAAALALAVGCSMPGFTPALHAQASPGPYEYLAFDDAFIAEAWMDLLSGTQIADWTGWSGSAWDSPNAYNGHLGTDFAVQTGTPVYAIANGAVTATESSVAQNDHSKGGFGNYVRIAVDGVSPTGASLDVITAHMLSVSVSAGQRVSAGQQIGLSDNTGNSTSEHVHTESQIRGSSALCPFYNAHFKYPIMFNPNGLVQVGHVVKITAPSTPVRNDYTDGAASITTAYKDQYYFASYWQRGYYRIFVPNNASTRSGWVRATDASEVFEGTVIQPLPDAGTYVHTATLQTPYPVRATPDANAAVLGQIVYGGGRFVADQVSSGWYRIALPGSATWGWVKPDSRMVVYPQLCNPAVNLQARPWMHLPIHETFASPGRSMFGRPKFNRSVVKAFTPASPGGDGNALFVTDATNSGDGVCESVIAGNVGLRNYYVQCDCYFGYKPTQSGYERYGIFLRDDGFGGMDQNFEGQGNGYAITYDSDDGRLRAARILESSITDFLPTARYVKASGWHTLRIEARENQIRYYLDSELLAEVTDTNLPCGPCGLGYSNRTTGWPADRGAYFDNFQADTLDQQAAVGEWSLYE